MLMSLMMKILEVNKIKRQNLSVHTSNSQFNLAIIFTVVMGRFVLNRACNCNLN
jgi:hypothetical protein